MLTKPLYVDNLKIFISFLRIVIFKLLVFLLGGGCKEKTLRIVFTGCQHRPVHSNLSVVEKIIPLSFLNQHRERTETLQFTLILTLSKFSSLIKVNKFELIEIYVTNVVNGRN